MVWENMSDDELRETLAAYAHDAWARWMEHLFTKGAYIGYGFIIRDGSAIRWKRQMRTLYADLPEDEKESDRREADKIIALLNASNET